MALVGGGNLTTWPLTGGLPSCTPDGRGSVSAAGIEHACYLLKPLIRGAQILFLIGNSRRHFFLRMDRNQELRERWAG